MRCVNVYYVKAELQDFCKKYTCSGAPSHCNGYLLIKSEGREIRCNNCNTYCTLADFQNAVQSEFQSFFSLVFWPVAAQCRASNPALYVMLARGHTQTQSIESRGKKKESIGSLPEWGIKVSTTYILNQQLNLAVRRANFMGKFYKNQL